MSLFDENSCALDSNNRGCTVYTSSYPPLMWFCFGLLVGAVGMFGFIWSCVT